MSQASTSTPQNNTTRNADSQQNSNSSTTTGNSQLKTLRPIQFVFDISHLDKIKLLNILEEEAEIAKNLNLWKDLATVLKIKGDEIESIAHRTRKSFNSSPFEDILCILADQARTIKELFYALYKLKQFKAMESIKHLIVEEKYLKLLSQPKPQHSHMVKLDYQSIVSIPDISILLNSLSQSGAVMLPAVINSTNSASSNKAADASEISIKSDMNIDELKFGIPEVPYDELTLATNSWNEQYKLGRGGFGTVFRGYWKNTYVAIKRIEPRNKKTASDDYKTELKQSLNELRYLNACRHDNILGLYGYSLSGENPCLVYELMPSGTLEQHLFKHNVTLKWDQKYYIAVGTARGLQFLHTFKEKPLIHGDIKPANILLDKCLQPKIGDFGLARESPSQKPVEISKAYGTRPYLPPEFIMTRCLSTKIDTYSFGIVLYEMATRKRVIVSQREPEHLIEMMNLHFEQRISLENVIDRAHPIAETELRIFAVLTIMGKECTATNAEERPEMVNVLKRLEGR